MPWHLPVGGGGVGLENKAKWTRGMFECRARTCSRIILRTSLLHSCAYVAWTTLAYAVRTYFNVPFHAIIIHQCRLLCLDWGSWLLASTERIAYKKEHNTQPHSETYVPGSHGSSLAVGDATQQQRTATDPRA
jgi:hypothetical protein